MSYETSKGKRANTRAVTLKASSAETATASQTGVELADIGCVRLQLTITAASGTNPTLDITVETSHDNGVADAWRSVGTFAQQTGVATTAFKSWGGIDRFIRCRSVITGTTPSFTYKVDGEGC